MKHKPDLLDLQCDRVIQALENVGSVSDKIRVLEQCLDYLRMEENESCGECIS